MLEKELKRKKRHNKIRKTIIGTAKRPRVVVFRSNLKTSAQIVNDDNGNILLSGDTSKIKEKGKKPIEKCKLLGTQLAEELKSKKIDTIVFDRNGYRYHGGIKEVAEGMREGGIKF